MYWGTVVLGFMAVILVTALIIKMHQVGLVWSLGFMSKADQLRKATVLQSDGAFAIKPPATCLLSATAAFNRE